MKFSRKILLRNLKLSNNYLEQLARGANIKLNHFITAEDLLEICNYIDNSHARTFQRRVLKERIEDYVKSQKAIL